MNDYSIRLKENEPWIRTANDKEAVRDGCWFDEKAAKYTCDFIETFLHHSKDPWAGQLFTLLPWERDDVVYPLFGWKRADGSRRFRTGYIEVPKKQGKSTLGAGIGLYLLVADGERGAEVYSVATKREQASIVHEEAVRMVKASPGLYARLKINNTTKTITYEETDGRYAALAAEARGAEGLNISGLIVDELHAWTDRPFWDALRFGGASRRQPLAFIITTAGISDQTSLGWQMHEYARKVLSDEVHDWTFYSYIRTAPMDMALTDRKAHEISNPSYGVTIQPDEIMEAAIAASQRPAEENIFRRYRLNQWVQQTERWLSVEAWDRCCGIVDEDDLRGRPCYGGLDLASRRDVTAFVLYFPAHENEPPYVLPRFFVPEEIAATRQTQNAQVQYAEWGRKGFLTLTPGNTISFEAVRQQIMADGRRFDVREIGADKWNLEYLRQELEQEGCPEIIEYQMTIHELSEPSKTLDAMIASGGLRHDGNPVMRWMVGNVTVMFDTNQNIRPDKKRSTEKIDGITALLMAIGRSMISETKGSVYETRGILSI